MVVKFKYLPEAPAALFVWETGQALHPIQLEIEERESTI